MSQRNKHWKAIVTDVDTVSESGEPIHLSEVIAHQHTDGEIGVRPMDMTMALILYLINNQQYEEAMKTLREYIEIVREADSS